MRAALAGAALLACLGAAAQDVTPCIDDAARQQALQRINAARAAGAACAAAGAGAVAFHARLDVSAWALASDLARRDTLAHEDAQHRPLGERLRSAGYALKSAAENVAAGQPTAEAAISAWLASPGHCENLMGRDYVDVGLACAQRSGTRYERFWVLQLARPAARR